MINKTIVTHIKVDSYFYELIDASLITNNIKLKEDSEAYLISVFTDFLKQEQINLFCGTEDFGFPSLFSLYKNAQTSPSISFNEYRNLGDMSLFIASFFRNYIFRRHSLNNLEYYVDMGSNAYLKASRMTHNQSFNSILGELALNFKSIKEALNRSKINIGG